MTDVLIVGAGPAGISCAIEAVRNGLTATILEQGGLVDAIRRFPTNVTWFSTPDLLEIGGLPFVTSTFRPNRTDTINYYRRVCEHFKLDIRCFDPVRSIRPEGNAFEVGTRNGRTFMADNVVVATGYFDCPNRLGIPGEDLSHVFHYYDEPFRYSWAHVTVVGGKNSAVEAALDLYRHGVHVTLVHRGPELSAGVKYWILPDILNRIKAGEIRSYFSTTVSEIRKESIVLQTPAGLLELENAFTFVMIGFSPDVELLSRFGLAINPQTLAPLHDAQTMETSIPGLFVAGSVVAGKENNKVFVENGRLHGGPIVKAILERKQRLNRR